MINEVIDLIYLLTLCKRVRTINILRFPSCL